MRWRLGFLMAASLFSNAQAMPFNAEADHAKVVECVGAHFWIEHVGDEVGLPAARWKAEGKLGYARFERLRPYAEVIEHRWNYRPGTIITEAAKSQYADQVLLPLRLAIGGDPEALFRESVAKSIRCDALVDEWNAAGGPYPPRS